MINLIKVNTDGDIEIYINPGHVMTAVRRTVGEGSILLLMNGIEVYTDEPLESLVTRLGFKDQKGGSGEI